MIQRIKALILKELFSLFQDYKRLIVLFSPTFMQLCFFSFAATLDVKNISIVIFNQDMGHHSNEIIQRVSASPHFSHVIYAKNLHEVKDAIDEQRAIVAIMMDGEFSRRIESGQTADMQTILDGRRSNASQIVYGYISNIVENYLLELDPSKQVVNMDVINWFNPNLLHLWSTYPCVVGILSMLITLVITALSIARERESGTFDQILVSPLLPFEILVGKTVPALMIGLGEGLLLWSVGVFLYGIPFRGSFLLLVFALILFTASVVGIGLFISSLARTQQQAISANFIFFVPSVSLSGYASPIENMPDWLQYIVWFNPLRHGVTILKGLFLKNMSFIEVMANAWPFIIIGCITMSLAVYTFSKRLE